MTDRRDRVAYVWDPRRRDASPAKRAFASECPQPNLASHRQRAAFGPLRPEADRSADDRARRLHYPHRARCPVARVAREDRPSTDLGGGRGDEGVRRPRRRDPRTARRA